MILLIFSNVVEDPLIRSIRKIVYPYPQLTVFLGIKWHLVLYLIFSYAFDWDTVTNPQMIYLSGALSVEIIPIHF